MSASSGQ